jgi:glycosyltransferase involved in cell wall biosynthesis
MRSQKPADVCLLLEGTYPFVAGGVSSWVHDLIRAHNDLNFAIVSITPDLAARKQVYEIPKNVTHWSRVAVGELPIGSRNFAGSRELPTKLAPALNAFLTRGGLLEFGDALNLLGPVRRRAGAASLLNSPEAWATLLSMYGHGFRDVSFLDYFWTWRALLTGFYGVVLADIPPARVYHAISTGYAGLMAARASIESGRPSLITEHGIYTNERRIEIALADWLHDPGTLSLGSEVGIVGLKALWTNAFAAYSRASYEAAHRITTLYRGNQEMQRRDGAAEDKLRVIPNGIDVTRFSALPRETNAQRPCVALIGRVVPIKDVKTFIRAVRILVDWIPQVDALVLGPEDEDPDYARECRELVAHLGLEGTLKFTGRVKLDEYLPRIDLNVLTSVSEAQPLVVLECGAAGIPSVATDVGCCRELVLGLEDEHPALGEGGAITQLASPMATAAAMRDLIGDRARLSAAGAAMKKRVDLVYNKRTIDLRYRALYDEAAAIPDAQRVEWAA